MESETPATPERLIRFETPEEFTSRPFYRPDLDPETEKPFKIFGGYRFAKQDWLKCGLIGCKQRHGAGFNIRNASGLETNIGHCCGKSRLGAVWAEMESEFQSTFKAQIHKDVLATVLANKETTLAHARALTEAVNQARAKIAPILEQLYSNHALSRAFSEAVKNRGALVYFRDLTEREREFTKERTVRQTMGRIQGVNAVDVDGQLERELKFQVVVPLAETDDDALKALEAKALEVKLHEFGAMGAILQRAEHFVEDADKLAMPLNWSTFEAFCVESKVNMNGQAHRILRRLAGNQ